jgi:hypothetical protein
MTNDQFEMGLHLDKEVHYVMQLPQPGVMPREVALNKAISPDRSWCLWGSIVEAISSSFQCMSSPVMMAGSSRLLWYTFATHFFVHKQPGDALPGSLVSHSNSFGPLCCPVACCALQAACSQLCHPLQTVQYAGSHESGRERRRCCQTTTTGMLTSLHAFPFPGQVLWLKSRNSEVWLDRRTTYTRSTAVMSMVGYLLGLGDRHPSNLMLDRYSGKLLHIDFGDCFEASMNRDKFPEKVRSGGHLEHD